MDESRTESFPSLAASPTIPQHVGMWRVALAGLVIACGGASEMRPEHAERTESAEHESTEHASTEHGSTEHGRTADAPSGDTEHANAALASTATSVDSSASSLVSSAARGSRDAVRDPRRALQVALADEAPEVRCAAPSQCPPSVGMVVFPGREPDVLGRIRPARCTGTLIAPDRVLTASHCLTTPTCLGAWITFPATETRPAGFAHCAWVLAQDPDDADAVLLEDWAILQLDRPIDRPVATLDHTPVAPGTIVTVASVTPHPIYDSRHELEGRLCRVETSEAAEARLGAGARRVGWLSGCPIEPGNSGSPVLDAEGRLRALVHAGSHPVFGIGVTTALPSVDLDMR